MEKNLKTSTHQIFEHYIQVGEIIAEKFSPYLEVIIHDLRFPEHSIIAIFNNHVTGRKVGEGTSDFGYKKVEGKVPEKVVNYKNESPDGKPLKASSLTIRNSQNEIIGSLGLNYDISIFEQFSERYIIAKKGEKNNDYIAKPSFVSELRTSLKYEFESNFDISRFRSYTR